MFNLFLNENLILNFRTLHICMASTILRYAASVFWVMDMSKLRVSIVLFEFSIYAYWGLVLKCTLDVWILRVVGTLVTF